MTPSDALSASPITNPSPPKPLNGSTTSTGNTITTALNYHNIASPSVSVSTFTLPADKKEEVVSGRERGSFDQTRGNWGNRIVLTTYPGQANVGTNPPYVTGLTIDPFPFDWGNPDPRLRGPSIFLLRRLANLQLWYLVKLPPFVGGMQLEHMEDLIRFTML